MLRKILNLQSPFKTPNHVVIVLDGDGEHYTNSNQSSHFLQLIHSINYFQIPIVSLVLVSLTSLALPSKKLSQHLTQILHILKKLEGKLDAKISICGDLNLCPNREIAEQITETCEKNTGKNLVQLYLFYSSLNSILKGQSQQEISPDLFFRTSGEHRLGDILLQEISQNPCYIYQKPFDLSQVGNFQLYRILTSWQVFSEKRKNLLEKDTNRFLFSKQFNKLKKVCDDEFTREESDGDSRVGNPDYFQ